MKQKRFFGLFEVAFDSLYLCTVLMIGVFAAFRADSPSLWLAASAALVLVLGDSFHLLPRIRGILTRNPEKYSRSLGLGKQVASITMTVFYVILLHYSLIRFAPPNPWLWLLPAYGLALVRIWLCCLPSNRWEQSASPVAQSLWRNLPFVLLGALVCSLFLFYGRGASPSLGQIPYAIALSFACYLPVVLGAGKYPALGMLMLPKSCAYVWLLLLLVQP